MLPAAEKAVRESAREIPLAYDVDVVVVGGSSSAVAAAVAAAEQGAKVFLAAPRPYLGEDICATYRLWLEPDEQPTDPLAKKLFDREAGLAGIRYTYQADQPSAGKHVDTNPPSMLADGNWGTAFSQSVQYDADTTITMDLGKVEEISKLHVMFYQGPGSFEVESFSFEASDDGRQWRPLTVINNDRLGKGSFVETAIHLTGEIRAETRYLRCLAKKTGRAPRMLLGEILVERVPAEEVAGAVRVTTPMQVKRSLDEALLNADVPFLYGCFATELLRDAGGELAGIVMANRAGRQAVKAKVIIDATERAWVARMSGARFSSYPAGPQEFKRIVVGGDEQTGPGIASRRIRLLHPIGGKSPIQFGSGTWATKYNVPMTESHADLIEYTLTIPMQDGSFASFAEAEQAARDRTFHPKQVDESEVLFQVPPDPMVAETSQSGAWPGAEKVALAAFRPKGIARLFILGGCADVSREAAAELIRPLEQMRV
ncbi:MAG: FAD-dependent oxidoreductase, partial [Patescibacteria group bacterium]|nr:FAD-dependent oxidoreductase [Patescibacteria group bacterium]